MTQLVCNTRDSVKPSVPDYRNTTVLTRGLYIGESWNSKHIIMAAECGSNTAVVHLNMIGNSHALKITISFPFILVIWNPIISM